MRLLIVDDHPITREGLRAAFDGVPDVEVVGEAASGEEAVRAVGELLPDVVLMDVRMPGMGGIAATRRIREEHTETKVILFTIDTSRASVVEAIKAGISGYLLKDVAADDLLNAARLAMEGKAVIHPELTRSFIDEMRMAGQPAEMRLSRREVEILQAIAYGSSTKQVATVLSISPHTVKTHLERIFEKLEVNDRAEAVAIALREGLVE